MIMTIILLVVGFIMLVVGAQHFVDGSAALAKNCKVSSLIVENANPGKYSINLRPVYPFNCHNHHMVFRIYGA